MGAAKSDRAQAFKNTCHDTFITRIGQHRLTGSKDLRLRQYARVRRENRHFGQQRLPAFPH